MNTTESYIKEIVIDELNALNEKTLTLYHGTCPENANELINNGWKPSDGGMGANMGNPKHLYLSSEPEDALWFAQEKGCGTLVEIKNIPIEYLRPDPEDEAGYKMGELINRIKTTQFPAKFILTQPLDSNHFGMYTKNENLSENSNILNEKTYKVYHGTNNEFKNFDTKRTPGGIIWFTDSIDSIKSGEAGAQGTKYIMTRYITINNPAGWDEYDKYGIQQLIDRGYDGVILPSGSYNTFIVFDKKNIKMRGKEDVIVENSTNESLNKYFPNIDLNTEDVFNLIDYHDSYINLYPEYDEYENEYGEDYYFPTKEDAYNDVNSTLNFFSGMPNPIPIFRTIKVKSLDDIDYGYLGDSWSFDKESAINFAKNQAGGNVLLSAKTNFDNVNWNNTLDVYYKFSDRDFNNEAENEITIMDSDNLIDVNAEWINKKSNVKEITNLFEQIINELETLNENNTPNDIWYHGSDYKFDTFENFQSSGPSALGIFVTDDKSFAEMFGENVYTVNIRYSKPYKISMDKWDSIRSEHAKDTTYFKNLRNYLVNKGYDSIIIDERENKFSSGMIIRDGKIVILFDKSQINIVEPENGLNNLTEEDYRGSHTAPTKNDSPMYDLTNTYDEDIYSKNAVRFYGDGVPYDQFSINIIQQARNKPEQKIIIYRAVPKILSNQEKINDFEKQKQYIEKYRKLPPKITNWENSDEYYDFLDEKIKQLNALPDGNQKIQINTGDWVTISPHYAKEHGENQFNVGNYRILKKTVPAKELYTDGNSIHEWGYVG